MIYTFPWEYSDERVKRFIMISSILIQQARNLCKPLQAYSAFSKMSSIRQNFHDDCEKLLNKQINKEMYASYTYLALYSYFIQQDQSLHGFAQMFFKNSQEEREHSVLLIDYLVNRGGKVVMEDVKKPEVELKTAKDAVIAALELEKEINQSLLDLHVVAEDKGDGHLSDFIEEHFLEEQVESIKDVGDLVTRIERAGEGLGLIYIDDELKKRYSKA